MKQDPHQNPYDPPKAQPDRPDSKAAPFLSRQTIFWGGLALIFVAITAFNLSHALYAKSRGAGGTWDTVVSIIDLVSAVAIITGVVAVLSCHWFPDRNRKYSWRRRR